MKTINSTKAKRRICAAAAVADLLLFFIKIYIAVSSNSISIYVDSLNSLADTFVCALAVAGFCVSLMKANEDYPFGYGRIEDTVSFLLSCVILLTGFAFAYTSLQRMFYPVPVWYSRRYAVLLTLTAFVKLVMAFAFKAYGKKYPSQILKNLKTDSILDFFISVCIVISFTLTQKVGYAVDALTGMIASVVIIIGGVRAFVSSIGILIGKADEDSLNEAYEVLSDNGIEKGDYKLYCHRYSQVRVYNLEINADSFNDGLMNKLQNEFRQRLDAELYIRTGGKENE